MGVPAAQLVAPAIGFLELLGCAAFILGVLVRPVAALLALNMLGALFLVHAAAGIFADKSGYELVLVLAARAADLAIVGADRFSVDPLSSAAARTPTIAALAEAAAKLGANERRPEPAQAGSGRRSWLPTGPDDSKGLLLFRDAPKVPEPP